ncbi:MAG: Eco57I restriction-modification methylase domain-containing protein [Ruminococcus sp.]
MAQKYDVVVTNPPYMGASNMNPKLSDFIKEIMQIIRVISSHHL